MSTSAAVFGTYELLENVLSHLPTKDLQNARLVCQDFNTVTNRSKDLQRNLFLEPAREKRLLRWREDTDDTGAVVQRPCIAVTTDKDVQGTRLSPIITEMHPGIRAWTPFWYYDAINDWSYHYGNPVHWQTKFEIPEPSRMLKWPKDGAWERRLIMQPACQKKALSYDVWGATSGDNGRHQREVAEQVLEDENGIRLGAVVEALKRLMYSAKKQLGLLEKKSWDINGRQLRPRKVAEGFAGCVEGFVVDDSYWVLEAEKKLLDRMTTPRMLTEGSV